MFSWGYNHLKKNLLSFRYLRMSLYIYRGKQSSSADSAMFLAATDGEGETRDI